MLLQGVCADEVEQCRALLQQTMGSLVDEHRQSKVSIDFLAHTGMSWASRTGLSWTSLKRTQRLPHETTCVSWSSHLTEVQPFYVDDTDPQDTDIGEENPVGWANVPEEPPRPPSATTFPEVSS